MPTSRKSGIDTSLTLPKAETRRAKNNHLPFEEGDMILCLHQGTLYYEAKITEMKPPEKDGEAVYTVHFQVHRFFMIEY